MHEHHVFFDSSDPIGMAVVVLGAIATAASFVLAFRWTVWPGEREPDHPKRAILREDR